MNTDPVLKPNILKIRADFILGCLAALLFYSLERARRLYVASKFSVKRSLLDRNHAPRDYFAVI